MQRIIWGAGWFSISIPSNTMRADVKRFIHSWMQCYFGLLHDDDPIENQILHSCKTLNNSWTMQLHPKLAALLGNSKVYIPVGKDSHVECLQSTLEYLITVQQIFKYGTLPLAGQVGQFTILCCWNDRSRAKSQFGKNRGHFDTGTVMSNSRVNAISPWAQKSILQLEPKSFCTL